LGPKFFGSMEAAAVLEKVAASIVK
jgi:hypothetical protein